MFENKKVLEKIRQEKEQLEILKQQISDKQREVLFIKEQLEDNNPKIDISNVYIWEKNGFHNIGYLNVVRSKVRRTFNDDNDIVDGYIYCLCDIFNNTISYEIVSLFNLESFNDYGVKEFIYPVWEANHNLLAYADKKVPLYVLQQLYYKLNKININDPILVKKR